MRHRDTRATDPPAITDDNAPLPPVRRRARWTARIRTVAYVLVGLAVAASLVSVYLADKVARDSAADAAAVERRLAVLEEDLDERTRQRDAERDAAAEEQERFRANLCVVLGQLSPTFPNLNRLLEALGCQSGVADAPPPAQAPDGAPAAGRLAPSPTGPSPAAPAPAPPPRPGSPTPASPSEPPRGPGLICGLLPPLC